MAKFSTLFFSLFLPAAMLALAHAEPSYSSREHEGDEVHSFTIDAKNPKTVYAVTFEKGIYKSADGGATWRSISAGLPQYLSNLAQTLAVDPETPDVLYLVSSDGVFKSTSGGLNWKSVLTTGIGEPARALVMDPHKSGALYVVTPTKIYKTVNGGEEWIIKSLDLHGDLFTSLLALDPHNPSVLFIGVAESLFKSVDGGESWQPSNFGLPDYASVVSMAIDPENSSLYLGTSRGLFKSADAGRSWEGVKIKGRDDLYVRCVAIDPLNTSVIYLGTRGAGILKSSDKGQTWSPLDLGVFDKDIFSIAVDPKNSQCIYAGTFKEAISTRDGGRTWMPIEGLPQLIENVGKEQTFYERHWSHDWIGLSLILAVIIVSLRVRKRRALTGLMFGLLGFVFFLLGGGYFPIVCSVSAIVLGHLELKAINQGLSPAENRFKAKAGLVLGWLVAGFILALILFSVLHVMS